MAVIYYCRHCGYEVGKLDKTYLQVERLGIQMLTEEEREEMVSYKSDGAIHIKSICENCYNSYTTNPTLHENDFLIH